MKRKFLLVGLTGGIGSGKSTVSRMFRDLGCLIIDADLLAREVVEPGEPAYARIVAEFGKQVLDAEGQIDRKKLGAPRGPFCKGVDVGRKEGIIEGKFCVRR